LELKKLYNLSIFGDLFCVMIPEGSGAPAGATANGQHD